MNPTLRTGVLLLLASSAYTQPAITASPLMAQTEREQRLPSLETPWTKEVTANNAHPEYPRPQFVRPEWQNLNGLWQYAVRPAQEDQPENWDGEILVPFAIESDLSSVGRTVSDQERLWYRREFAVPAAWGDQRVVLHFGAVDWQAHVWVNGREIGSHRGGYDAFSFDVTDALLSGENNTLVVAVFDPTDAGTQPRGKQVREPRAIWYTSVTGIWQTVWLEPVPERAIGRLEMVPRLGSSGDRLELEVETIGATTSQGLEISARALAPGAGPIVASSQVGSGGTGRLSLEIEEPQRWTPDQPFLYDLEVELREPTTGAVLDRVTSYFGLRDIQVGASGQRPPQLLLNGEPLFQLGPLDQGWWPDGLYTPATDAALLYDLEVTKALGFNMLRKHVKVESARFYYHCDRLGLLVWQDMPSGDEYIRANEPDVEREKESADQFRREWQAIIEGLRNHPSIVMWVPFNEGWGQFDTAGIVELTRSVDPTRLVNATSGWADRGVGDVLDIHSYPGPAKPKWEERRAGVLGEFGGLGLPLSGHLWKPDGNWGYRAYPTRIELGQAYRDLIEKLEPMVREGLAAAVYTQTSDVEIEVNGLMTYDRRVTKLDPEVFAPINRALYGKGGGGPRVTQEPFGSVDGKEATLFTLISEDGLSGDMTVRVTDFGGTLVGLDVPARDGTVEDVLLGFDSATPYGERTTPYFGAIVGRYANRIGKGRFKLDGKRYRLPINNGENSLHGGLDGLSRVFWSGTPITTDYGAGVELHYLSPDGEEGYPGNLEITVRYLLTPDRELRIETEAKTDEPTVVNLSFHPYFNLSGQGRGDILDHELQLLASHFTPVDAGLIPTGEIRSVEGTPMDFREPTRIGERIDVGSEQLRFGQGYDHNWVLDDSSSRGSRRSAQTSSERGLQRVAVLRDPASGRQMEVLTTQPGIQFYSGNFLDGTITGKQGVAYPRHGGLCLETQHFPDSPNHPDFPSTVLRPGQSYRHVTVYRFSTF